MGNLSTAQTSEKGQLRHIWIITGPSGCGKSTVAEFLAKQLNLPYIEGDNYHSEANVAKMANGISLTDSDRWDWLETLRNEAVDRLASGSPGCVVTCSALKRKYRDIIRLAGQQAPDVCVRFVYLRASEELLLQRVKNRQNHYFKGDSMVKGQFSILEEPNDSEQDVIAVDVGKPLQAVKLESLEKVLQCMEEQA